MSVCSPPRANSRVSSGLAKVEENRERKQQLIELFFRDAILPLYFPPLCAFFSPFWVVALSALRRRSEAFCNGYTQSLLYDHLMKNHPGTS